MSSDTIGPYAIHPVANLFPMMSDEEYQHLVADIRQNGQQEQVWILNGSVLDGRNRVKACVELGITPQTRMYQGAQTIEALVAFVTSLNLARRHLSSSQRACIALDIERIFAEEAKERQRESGRFDGRDGDGSPRVKDKSDVQVDKEIYQPEPDVSPEERAPQAIDRAAAAVGTNRQYVSDAKKIATESPDLFEQVKRGEVSIPKAKQQQKQRKRYQAIEETEQANATLPVEQRTYRVIYADPPWKYGNTMPDYFDEQAHHYPLMTIKEICAMPIKDIAMDNAVLFLWVTSPILAEAFDVIRAWDFTYKSSFVWDKVKHNMGHYNSVRHELLLICTRGSCPPDVQKLFDSVQSIERTGHSEKPPQFREIIDTIYPHGPRIELFARTTPEGWDVYGNQASG